MTKTNTDKPKLCNHFFHINCFALINFTIKPGIFFFFFFFSISEKPQEINIKYVWGGVSVPPIIV